jgi:hypothetical protein
MEQPITPVERRLDREGVAYLIAGVIWAGIVAYVVVFVAGFTFPDSGRGEQFISSWLAFLIWPTVIGLIVGRKRRNWPRGAQWFFWVSVVLSPITWPFFFA